jgi:hypothetical protein
LWQTTEKAIVRKEKHLDHEDDEDEDEEIIYKIDVPANRSVSVSLMPSPLFLLLHPYVLPLWMESCDKV